MYHGVHFTWDSNTKKVNKHAQDLTALKSKSPFFTYLRSPTLSQENFNVLYLVIFTNKDSKGKSGLKTDLFSFLSPQTPPSNELNEL